MMAAVTCFA